MKITQTNNCKKVMFENVDQGSIIVYNDDLYMKLDADTNFNANVVNLKTGVVRYIPSNMLILLVENYEFTYLL